MWEYENCMHLSNIGRILRVGESAALEMTYCHGSYSSPESPMKPSLLLLPLAWGTPTARKHCECSFCNLISHDLTKGNGFPIDKCSALQEVF